MKKPDLVKVTWTSLEHGEWPYFLGRLPVLKARMHADLHLAEKLEAAQPAVEFVARYVEAENTKGLREVAKVLGALQPRSANQAWRSPAPSARPGRGGQTRVSVASSVLLPSESVLPSPFHAHFQSGPTAAQISASTRLHDSSYFSPSSTDTEKTILASVEDRMFAKFSTMAVAV